jgi:hypothetical protein
MVQTGCQQPILIVIAMWRRTKRWRGRGLFKERRWALECMHPLAQQTAAPLAHAAWQQQEQPSEGPTPRSSE